MDDPRKDPPLQEDTSRSLWIGWGVEGLAVVLGYFLGGRFVPYFAACFCVVMIVRGWKPALFAHHIDAQIIAGIPYRRIRSYRAWGFATLLSVVLAGAFSWIHQKVSPETPDLEKALVADMRKLLEKQPLSVSPVVSDLPLLHIEPERGVLNSINSKEGLGEFTLQLHNAGTQEVQGIAINQEYFTIDLDKHKVTARIAGTNPFPVLKPHMSMPIHVTLGPSATAGLTTKHPMIVVRISALFRNKNGQDESLDVLYGAEGPKAEMLYGQDSAGDFTGLNGDRIALADFSTWLKTVAPLAPSPSYVSRLDLDSATIGETLDNPKYTAVEIRHHNGGTSPITLMAHEAALVFHTAALSTSDITAYQDQILTKVMKSDLDAVAGFGADRYGLIHIPSAPGSGSERLEKERLNILNANTFLYVFVAYKYRDVAMPSDLIGLTEWCIRFNGPISVFTTAGRNASSLRKVDKP